ncbi:nucleotidyltransferase family protein [uncultured Tateyamaria sp.]|uniref:nucleotidyltransferase family protein n=1 Tax=uncultured Tateyamaria sp. TaxID=455651 RepID=UPI0026230A9D|nr:nucleotidyltransferase family protein [uncultured Tateyamaria sp.]
MMPILILAAGASSRMGGVDKLLCEVDGQPLLARQARMARGVSNDVRIALPPRPHSRYAALEGLDVRAVEVAEASEGMNASLRALFATLHPDTSHAMLLLADLPDLTGDDLRRVIAASEAHPDALIWRGATTGGTGGHPMIFAARLFPAFQNLSGDSGGQSIVASVGDAVHLVPFDNDRARRDLDTPQDWAAWRAARTI